MTASPPEVSSFMKQQVEVRSQMLAAGGLPAQFERMELQTAHATDPSQLVSSPAARANIEKLMVVGNVYQWLTSTLPPSP